MKLRQDLTKFLETTIRDSDNKQRDIEIISYYYGLGGTPSPTMTETADHFEGFATRQRISQIIIKYFKAVAKLSELPTLEQINGVLVQREFWWTQDLSSQLIDLRLISHSSEIQGFFALIEDLGTGTTYRTYTPDLRKISERTHAYHEEAFIIDDAIFPKLQQVFREVKKSPGQIGIANLRDMELGADVRDAEDISSMIEMLILHNQNAWTKREDDGFWFLFEDADNRLKNYNRKVFSIVECCDPDRLAETYENALQRRTVEHGYPTKEIIASYLRGATDCEIFEGDVYFNGRTSRLTEIEKDIVEYLSEHSVTLYPPIRDAMVGKRYKKPTIDKAVYNSPIVHVDKRGDRTNFVFSLVGVPKDSSAMHFQPPSIDVRYRIFQERLMAVQETDQTDLQKRRMEQPHLSSWLFGSKESENCGICGQMFSVAALHAAHKKKRSLCSPSERRDLHIVMPMCVFGCDYLYENGVIRIKDGIVRSDRLPHIEGPERDRVSQLIGRKIDDRWLDGPKSYFEPMDR